MAKDRIHKFYDGQTFRDFMVENAYVVINFTSRESIKTNDINSVFTELSDYYPKVKFIQLVKEEILETFNDEEVSEVPTFKFSINNDYPVVHTRIKSGDLFEKIRAFSKKAEADERY
ncbi:hypothetical protein IWW56_001416 [Coemansia sp. RSA 2131]|nr:hypothetical protein IWW56_001416 [Coemansia sp. RSA 2131]